MSFTPDQLLALAERALDRLDWGEVHALASDVLLLEPGNAEASMLRDLATRHGERGSLPGRRQATALFADLVNSTQLAERYDVEIYNSVLRTFEEACLPILKHHEGYLVDVQGDAIVACFGYPNAHEDDASRAVSAALDILAALRQIAVEPPGEPPIEVHARVGIDTGLVVIDGTGIHGAAMNRAARLQTLATSGTVLISATSRELVKETFDTHGLGHRQLKGTEAPVEVFQVIGARDQGQHLRGLRSMSVPIIGRDLELRSVLELWDEIVAAYRTAQPSSGVVVLVTGDPGIGKSRLASAVEEHAIKEGTQAIELYCSSYNVTSTLFPVRTAIERYAGIASDDTVDKRVDKLEAAMKGLGVEPADVVPALGMLLALDLSDRYPPPQLAPLQLREFLLERLVTLLHAIAANGPVVMVIEDLHWADPTTLELLDRLTKVGLPAGVLILGTSRPGLSWAPDSNRALTIHLDPLSDDQAQELAMAASPGQISEADAREIAARGDGVPFFVEELARAFSSTDHSLHRNGTGAVPRTLMQLLQARLDSVGPAKAVAQVAATIGREFETSLLDDVMRKLIADRTLGPQPNPLQQQLTDLLNAQVIETMDGDGLLRFRHVLMRDAAYESQLIGDRAARHRAVAEVLADATAADPALTAFHFDRAGRPLDALAHYLQAVGRARATGAFAEALAHLDRCDALLSAVPDETIRAQFELGVRLNRGLCISSTLGYAASKAVADFGRARELCEQLRHIPGIGAELLKALFGLWSYHLVSGDLDICASLSSAIQRQLEDTAMPGGRPALDACEGVEAFFRGDLLQAVELLSRAVARIVDDSVDLVEWPLPNDPMAAAYAFLGPANFLTGDMAGALDAIRLGVNRSQSLEFPIGPFSLAFVRNYEGLLRRAIGAGGPAAAASEEVIQIGERYGFLDWQLVGRIHLAAAKVLAGAAVEDLDEMDEAITSWHTVGGEAAIPWLRVEQAAGYFAREDLSKAASCLSQAFAEMERGQRIALPEGLRLRAEISVRMDQSATSRADADIREAIAIARAQGNVYSVLRSALTHHRIFGFVEDAWIDSALAEAVTAYREGTEFPDLVQARAHMSPESRRVSLG